MRKNRIRLSEGQLRNVIKESVYRILNEGNYRDYTNINREDIPHNLGYWFPASNSIDGIEQAKELWDEMDYPGCKETLKYILRDIESAIQECDEVIKTLPSDYYDFDEPEEEDYRKSSSYIQNKERQFGA